MQHFRYRWPLSPEVLTRLGRLRSPLPSQMVFAVGTLIEYTHLGHFGPLEDPAGMAEAISAWVVAHP